jgi:hypothetical protein
MTWRRNVLVVANVTAASSALSDVLKGRGEAKFTLIVPATPFGGGREAAAQNLDEALRELREAGLDVDGRVGHPDPIVAVTDAWDPGRYDEIVVCTLPMRFSKWLHAGLPERIQRLTGALVTHVVARPERPAVEITPAPPHERAELGPLSVLGWGAHREQSPPSLR